MKIVYATEPISSKNKNEFFSCEESLKIHKNNKQIKLLGVIYNVTKEFRIEGSYSRDTTILSQFVNTYV